jgi:hypothetical protein
VFVLFVNRIVRKVKKKTVRPALGEASLFLYYMYFPYFVDTTERGDKGAKAEEIGVQRRVTLQITLLLE